MSGLNQPITPGRDSPDWEQMDRSDIPPSSVFSENQSESLKMLGSRSVVAQPSMAPFRSKFVNLKRRQLRFNLIFAGHTGTGKTTTMHNLFKDWDIIRDDNDHMHMRSEPGVKTESIFQFAKYKVDDDASFTRLIVHVYDSRGYGDVDESSSSRASRKGEDSFWEPIDELLDFVGSKAGDRYKNEQLVHPHEEQKDPIMHCCLYFLQPHRVHDADMVFMKKLSQHVPIIPIIAKADTLNDQELAVQRKDIVKQLARRKINTCSVDVVDRGSTYATVEKEQDVEAEELIPTGSRGRLKGQPFAIVARDSHYPWGTLNSDNKDHSDFAYLRDALIYDHAVSLINLGENRYQKYRSTRKLREMQKSILTKSTKLVFRLTEFCAVALGMLIIHRDIRKRKAAEKHVEECPKQKHPMNPFAITS